MTSTQLKKLLLILIVWRIGLIIVALIVGRFLPLKSDFMSLGTDLGPNVPYFVGIWANFDAIHYMTIARVGYESFRQPFFPLYPIFIRLVHEGLLTSYIWSGLIVSHFTFVLSFLPVMLLWKLDQVWFKKNFVLVLLFFPTSFFYGSVYNDALFFLLATTTLYFGQKRRWGSAGMTGALATLTRLNGLLLFFYLGCEYVFGAYKVTQQWEFQKWWQVIRKSLSVDKLLSSTIWFISLIPLAFIGYLGYIQWKFGSWQTLFSAMKIWGQSNTTFPPQVVWRYLKIFASISPSTLVFWVAVIEFLFVCWYVYIAIWSFKKIRLSYWIFLVGSILLPWITGTFQGMPRYALHVYPFFLASAMWFTQQSKVAKLLYLTVCTVLMCVILALYTRGYFIT